jgi:DNA-binding MurR/RpiR family transcriptional regulator
VAKQAVKKQQSLEARVYALYATLSPAERRLADVMLQHQMELASYTAGELASLAGVSRATAARFVRLLGYESYGEAKRQVRTMQYWGSPRAGLSDPDQPPSGEVSLAEMMRTDISNIRTTAESISEEALRAAAGAIASARRLWVMGLRSGYGLAHQAHHYFSLIKPDVQVLPVNGASYSQEMASFQDGDILLVIAFRRRPRILPTILSESRALGVGSILITDLSASASAKAADHVLRCKCECPAPFNSFSAALTLIHYLAWAVTNQLGEKSLERFRLIDRLVTTLDDVSTPADRKKV